MKFADRLAFYSLIGMMITGLIYWYDLASAPFFAYYK